MPNTTAWVTIYFEGLTEKTMPNLRRRLDVVNDLKRLEDLGGLATHRQKNA